MSSGTSDDPRHITLRGARVHNLRGVDVDLPRGRFVVITGPSGSGKSSLAFDTIYAESQRRYVESLSPYARQFLERLPRPDVDAIEGLSPALSTRQQVPMRNPRSTVGTATEIHDYLRLLYARVGEPHCPVCGQGIVARTVQQIVDRVLAMETGTRFAVLAPVVRAGKGDHVQLLERLRKQGFVRARIDGETQDLGEDIRLDADKQHTIEVSVDRLAVKEGIRQRVTEAVELASSLADGLIRIAPRDGEEELLSEKLTCLRCGSGLPAITPRTFSFNDPSGACPDCSGLGETRELELDRVVADSDKSIDEGAIAPWGKPGSAYHRRMVADLRKAGIDADTSVPWAHLAEATRERILYGDASEGGYEGVLPQLRRKMREYERRKRDEGASEQQIFEMLDEELGAYTITRQCEGCGGARLRPESLSVTVAGYTIHELSRLSVAKLGHTLDAIEADADRRSVAERILREARERIAFLLDVGLHYLTLDRGVATLSGGEAERLRLATQIGAGLVGVLYVLDEPSIGLHPRDVGRLVDTLVRLRDRGNTVVVVEHDGEVIRAADYVLDMGPGAGREGGEVVVGGPLEAILADDRSPTGAYLAGRRRITVPSRRRRGTDAIGIRDAQTHNLRGVSVDIPLAAMTCVGGVSGSGKSSLIMDTLVPAARRVLHRAHDPLPPAEVQGLQKVARLVAVDQGPIGRTPRSSPATYTGILTQLRQEFAKLPEARARGYGAGRFSFNNKGGRCEGCKGEGLVRVEMHFLPDVYVRCAHCEGRRYNRETLEIQWKGYNIADVLEMRVDEALPLFRHVPKLRTPLETLHSVGLGYLELGRSATTLSGGEAQRIKLARELARGGTGPTLYVLDEPTTGLHFVDIEILLGMLRELVSNGHTVVVIEHDLEVLKSADYLIELGPEGGDEGGAIVATGTPEQVAERADSPTAPYLRRAFQ